MEVSAKRHYDLLIEENNDPVRDSDELKKYMDKWDGEEFVKKMAVEKADTVLEIGVGTGRLAVRVAPLCEKLLGVDLSPKTVERAKENLAEFKNVSLICSDFMTHEFGCGFDVIYSSLTFMHIRDKQTAFDKISELLNENGRFVLSTDKTKNEYIDMAVRRVRVYPDFAGETVKYAKNAGLKLKEQYETEFAEIFIFDK